MAMPQASLNLTRSRWKFSEIDECSRRLRTLNANNQFEVGANRCLTRRRLSLALRCLPLPICYGHETAGLESELSSSAPSHPRLDRVRNRRALAGRRGAHRIRGRPDHERFLGALADGGLQHALISQRVARQNQVLIVSNETLGRGTLQAPAIHPAVPPNALEAILEPSGLHVVGFRIPAFEAADRPLKRQTWNWLLSELDRLRARPALIAGDFNTAPNDPASRCGDCFATLSQSGWRSGTPTSGYSWRHAGSGAERQIDHLFLSPAMSLVHSEYCWDFERLSAEAASKKVGLPDHAMLVAEIAAS